MAWDWLTGSSGGMEQYSTMTPQQQAMQNQLISGIGGAQGQGLQYLFQLLSNDPQAMAAFEAPYKRQFQQETIPGLAERFQGMGSFGGDSSAQGLAYAQAGRELSENLAALRGNLKNNALQQLQGFMQQAYAPQFENVYEQPTMGLAGIGVNALGSVGGAGLNAYAAKKWGG